MIVSMATSVVSGLVSALGWFFSRLLSPVPLTVIAVALCLIYYFVTKEYDFWTSRGFNCAPSKFPWGNEFGPPFLVSFPDFEQWIYHTKGGKKFCGYLELTRPVLYVGDLDLVRLITVKDFEHFTNRRDLAISKDFTKMLQLLKDAEWKETRSVMSPTFSSSKLRQMHQLCLDNAENLSTYMREAMTGKKEIDMKDAFGRFTMDNIASCAFGVNCNSFTDPNSEFAVNAAKLFEVPSGYGALRLMGILFFGIDTMQYVPDPLDSVNKFFRDVARKTMAHHSGAGGDKRHDFMQMLLEAKDKNGQRILSEDSIIAQSVLFFIVGYDTTASLLVFSAYCLATNPELQTQVQREIDDTLQKFDDQLTYEAVAEMTLLDRVLSETLRLYPPVLRQERECTKDYTLPDTNLTVPRGTTVQIPIFAIHRDPEIYPEPMKFDPDRFLPKAKESRHPCAYMPFGSGPRNCIAMRFALFEAKVALIAVLRRNRLEPGPNTPPPPMPLDKHAFLLSPAKGKGVISVVPR